MLKFAGFKRIFQPVESDHREGYTLTILLGCLAALPPLAIEASLPAIPLIAAGLTASMSAIQISFSGMFVGMAAGQLLAGPLCDKFGRRPVLILGLIVFIVAGLGCVFAPSADFLILCRIFQGLGGSVGVLVSKAAPRDIWVGAQLTTRLSFITSIVTITMLSGPLVGGAALHFVSWQALFLIFPLAGIILLIVAARMFPETLPTPNHTGISAFKRYRIVLSQRRPMIYFFANSCLFAAMITFITGSPTLLMVYFGMDMMVFSISYGACIGFMFIGSLFNGFTSNGRRKIFNIEYGIFISISAMLVLLIALIRPNAIAILIGGALFAASCGINYPNSQAAGLSRVKEHAGVAAGLIGTLAYLMGALSSGLVGLLGPASLDVLVGVMIAFGLAGTGILAALEHIRVREEQESNDIRPELSSEGQPQ